MCGRANEVIIRAHPTPPHAHPPIPPPNVKLIVWCKNMATVASLSDARRQEVYRSAKDVSKRKNWQRWIRRISCLIKRSARPNKYMTNNMARQREQSQDKPAWEPLNTTWPQKPEASHWNITTLWAKREARTKAGKTDPQNVPANSNKWQCWIWCIVKNGSGTHSANQSKVWRTTWHGKGNNPKPNQPENH